MAKAPSTRGFTRAEKRGLRFEQVSLYMVFVVALIAATISFIALRSVGADAGLGQASFLLPLAIDGFGIACSVGIVRSVSVGERWRDRASEWLGLFGALALSVLGNVYHALEVGEASLPDLVKIAYAAAIPLIVAYGIHVYGRAMSKGISAHVLADAPDELVFGLQHLGDESRTVARTRAPLPRAPKVQESAQPVAREFAPPARMDDEQARARVIFDAHVAADPHTKPDAAAIMREAGIERHPATPRRWVQRWWDEHEESMGTGRPDPIAEQVAADAPVSVDRAS